jgi:REP element-mobilizing transposase RayT
MLTRRVRGRTLLLRPCPRTNQIVKYVVAVMAKRWNIEVHALTFMGNHWHGVVTDPDGNIVEFQRDTHHFIARALNTQFGEVESIWASDGTSRVECEQPEDVVERIAYTMANPVEAGLVRHGSSWPGARRAWPAEPVTIKKPPKFFRDAAQGGTWPAEVTLVMTRPPGYDELSDDELAGVIQSAIDEREQRFRDERDATGKDFLGRRRVLEQKRHACARSPEARSRLNPTIACRNRWARVERLQSNKRWLNGYYSALARWRAGERDVEFPHGTYKMRVVHAVRCASGPD